MFVFLMVRRPPRSTLDRSSAASDVYKRQVQSNISGVTDYIMKNDEECIAQIRSLIEKIGKNEKAGFDRIESKLPKYPTKEIFGVLPEDTLKPYNTCLLYTSPSPRDRTRSRMPSSA